MSNRLLRSALPAFALIGITAATLGQEADSVAAGSQDAPSALEGDAAGSAVADSPDAGPADARQRLLRQLEEQLSLLESEGESLDRLEGIGDLYLRLGDTPRAVVVYERAIKEHGGSEQLFYKLATSLMLGGRPELGLKILQLATEAYPDSARLLIELGKTFHGMGKQYAAVAALKKAAALEPENEVAQFHLAEAYRAQRKLKEAESIVDELIDNDSDWLPAHLLKADLLLTQKNHRQAVRLLEDLRQKRPDSQEAKLLLNRAYQLLAEAEVAAGRFGQAVKSLESALELFPDDTNTIASLGTVHYEAGEREEAEARFRQLTESYPEFLDGFALHGTLMRMTDRKDEARALFEQGLTRSRAARSEEHVKRFEGLLSSR